MIEYSILLAFVALAAVAIYLPTAKGVTSIWSATSVMMEGAVSAASRAYQSVVGKHN